MLARARDAGVGVESLASYCANRPAQPGLVLGYGAIPPVDVDEGLRRLAESFWPADIQWVTGFRGLTRVWIRFDVAM